MLPRVLVVAAVAAAAFASSSHAASWTPSDHPVVSGKTIIFQAATAAGNDDVWTVGWVWGTVGGATEFRTMIQHWNGSEWRRVPSPDRETAPAVNQLYGVSAAAPDDVWAVGSAARALGGRSLAPMVQHWDGTSWSIVELPLAEPVHHLHAVAARRGGNVWAVGSQPNRLSGYHQPLIWRRLRDGTWGKIPMKALGGCLATSDGGFWMAYPHAVAAVLHSAVYVGGYCLMADSSRRAFLVRWNGSAWQSVLPGGGVGPADSEINGMAMTPNEELWAVGRAGEEPLVYHGSGRSFQRETVPGQGTYPGLNAVAASHRTRVFAAGAWSGPAPQPNLLSRLGGRWAVEPATAPDANLWGAAAEPSGRAWAVGNDLFPGRGAIYMRSP